MEGALDLPGFTQLEESAPQRQGREAADRASASR